MTVVKKHLIFARFIECLCMSRTKPLSDHYCALSENSLCSVCTPMVSLHSTVLFFRSSRIVSMLVVALKVLVWVLY